jgi:predicted Zn-dependent protease
MSIFPERSRATGGCSGRWPRAFARLFVGLFVGLCCAHQAGESMSAENPRTAPATPAARDGAQNAARADDRAGAGNRTEKGKTAVQAPREAQIRELVQKVNAAIGRRDFALAEALLDALGRFLPEQSLTMLRMRAWLAISADRNEMAREYYRRILERIGDDENAGINLALLAARAGEKEEAARILADLARRHPDSPHLEGVRQALGLSIGHPPAQSPQSLFRE